MSNVLKSTLIVAALALVPTPSYAQTEPTSASDSIENASRSVLVWITSPCGHGGWYEVEVGENHLRCHVTGVPFTYYHGPA